MGGLPYNPMKSNPLPDGLQYIASGTGQGYVVTTDEYADQMRRAEMIKSEERTEAPKAAAPEAPKVETIKETLSGSTPDVYSYNQQVLEKVDNAIRANQQSVREQIAGSGYFAPVVYEDEKKSSSGLLILGLIGFSIYFYFKKGRKLF